MDRLLKKRTGLLLWAAAALVGVVCSSPIAHAVNVAYKNAVIFGGGASSCTGALGKNCLGQNVFYMNSADGQAHMHLANGTEYAVPQSAVASGGGYATAANSGTPLTQRAILNFSGAVTCSDNSGASRTDCHVGQPGVYSVLEYGAVGDNSTDNTTAFAAAVTAACASTQATLLLPYGIYKTSTLAVSSCTGLTIKGEEATIVGTVDANPVVSLTSCSGCTVTGLIVKHLTAAARNNSGHGINSVGCANLSINHNEVTHTAGVGIMTNSGSVVDIERNYVHGTLADGIHNTNGTTDLRIAQNASIGTGDDGIAVVGYQSNATVNQHVTIVGNVCRGQVQGRGIALVGVDQATVSANITDTTPGAGITVAQETAISPTRAVSHVALIGNDITNANTSLGVAGIEISGTDPAFPVSDVLIAANKITGGAQKCIGTGTTALDQVDDLTVVGNKCLGPNGSGPGISFLNIRKGTIKANTVTYAYASGISVGPDSVSVTSSDNNIYYPNQGNAANQYGSHNASTAAFNGLNFVTPDPGKTALLDSDIANANQGIEIQNQTAATSGAPTQNSHCVVWSGQAWNTSSLVSQEVKYELCDEPGSGNPVSGNLSIYVTIAGGSRTKIATITSGGAFKGNGISYLTDGTFANGNSSAMPLQTWSYVYATKLGASVASASTIGTSNKGLFHITGTTTINTMNLPLTGFVGTIRFVTDSAVTFGGSGNIAASGQITTAAGQLYEATFDGTSWYIK